MQISARLRLRSASTVAILALSAGFLAACSTSQQASNVKQRSKEYFAESVYGVKASPRVAFGKGKFARGGGRDQLGKPYKVRGKWYYPKEDKNYRSVGAASWYGDAFHGRLTANGEIYDMTHLTAAHPTMPLPSYARVTNMKNGSSVIVRVNDRGPYSNGRVIDLSKKAAEMLDYAHGGTAKVKVEYVGRAPLDGHDDQYLMASYRPGNKAPDPSDGLPTGVMIAMDGPTPSEASGKKAVAFPGILVDAPAQAPIPTLVAEAAPVETAAQPSIPFATADAGGFAILPDFGPIVPERPDDLVLPTQVALATMSYADDRVGGATDAFAVMENGRMSPTDVVRSWKRLNPGADAAMVDTPFVAAGSFQARSEAKHIVERLSGFGKAMLDKSRHDGETWYTVSLYPDGRYSLDAMLEAAWSNGAPDAMTVRD